MLIVEPNNMNAESENPAMTDIFPSYVKQKEKPVYTLAERVISPVIFLFTVLFVRYIVFYQTGIISTFTFFIFFTVSIIYLNVKKFEFSKFNKALSVILYLFGTVYSITDNSFIKFLNTLFLVGASAYLIFSVCSGRKDVERYLPYAIKYSVFKYPFTEFDSQLAVMTDSMKDSKTSTNIKRVIGGLILTIPVTIIIALLLMSADDEMDRILVAFFSNFNNEDLLILGTQILIALPCSFYVFGMLYSNVYRRKITELTESECEFRLSVKRRFGNLVFYTAATPILLLYIMYFVLQASYFLSAFMGRLPDGFSYAEYARQGFFELCWIVVINLFIMIIMNLHSAKSGRERTTALKIFNIIFCVFTLILIATAISKMVMYIDAYGLTVKRVHTTWFMVLCAFMFLMILIKQFNQDIHISKWISIGFTVMFAVLCFSRSEALIVRYNYAMGKTTAENCYDSGIMDMSDDGLLAAVNEGIMSAETAKSLSSDSHYRHTTDGLNISTMILENKLAESYSNE